MAVPPPAQGPTVGQVIAELGGVDVLCAAPGALDARVRRTHIWDAGSADPKPGDLVLAVGLVPASPQLSGLLVAARDTGVAAIAIRGLVNLAWVRTEAERLGVTVVVVSRELAWDVVHARVRTIVATWDGAACAAPSDLYALANTAAAALGGPVEIDDAALNLLAFSNLGGDIDPLRTTSILTRRPPAEFVDWMRDTGTQQRLRHADGPLRIDPPGNRTRLVAPVRAGIDLLGYVWVAEGDERFTERHRRTLGEVAKVISAQLMRAGTRPHQRRDEQLVKALDGDPSTLDLDARMPVVLMGFRARDGWVDDAVDPLYVRNQVELRGELTAVPGASAVITGGQVYVLIPVRDGRRPDSSPLAEQVVRQIGNQLGRELVVAIGDGVLGGLHEVRQEVDRALMLLAARPGHPVATCTELRSQVTIALLQEIARDHPQLLAGPLRELAEMDRTRKTDYLGTLRAYFDAASDLTEAARVLFVHRNTLRYRLRRIKELCGLDLTDPVERLVAELQLRLLDEPGAVEAWPETPAVARVSS